MSNADKDDSFDHPPEKKRAKCNDDSETVEAVEPLCWLSDAQLRSLLRVSFTPAGVGESEDGAQRSPGFIALMEGVVQKCVEKDTAAIFTQPVDRDLYPEYYQLIQHPMDLRTLRQRVRARQYSSLVRHAHTHQRARDLCDPFFSHFPLNFLPRFNTRPDSKATSTSYGPTPKITTSPPPCTSTRQELSTHTSASLCIHFC